MAALSRKRLRPFARRAGVIRVDGTRPLPVAGGRFDRFLAVYVLDLLSPADAWDVVAEARRVLRPGGLLCAVSLAPGVTPGTRLISRAWAAVGSRAPRLVGGCRPITLGPLLDGWDIEHRGLVSSWGLTSEVVIARR
ncbi:MAG: class I SAM-dependent methyltransferase [Micromonosporaceae bacterium]